MHCHRIIPAQMPCNWPPFVGCLCTGKEIVPANRCHSTIVGKPNDNRWPDASNRSNLVWSERFRIDRCDCESIANGEAVQCHCRTEHPRPVSNDVPRSF